MAEKGFAKAEDIKKISKEEMKTLVGKDLVAAVKGAKEKRSIKAYEDEFTEAPKVTEEDEKGADIDIPEPLDEPEVPEKKPTEEKEPVENTERTSKEIAQDIYNQGFNAGHKQARLEMLEKLVG